MLRNENILLAAFVVSLAATLGALYIGEVLGQTPCILCWYQRIAMFPLVVLLGIAAFNSVMAADVHDGPVFVQGTIGSGIMPKYKPECQIATASPIAASGST